MDNRPGLQTETIQTLKPSHEINLFYSAGEVGTRGWFGYID
jgi:hypothetical protein